MINIKKQNQSKTSKNKVNPLVAGVAGATVGAGVAVAASVAMNDKKNRQRVEKVIGLVKEQATEYIENLQSPKNMKKGKQIVKEAIGKAAKNVTKKSSTKK